MKFRVKTTILTLCAILVVGTAFARKEQLTVREKVELGKKVSVHRLIKSADPELIYTEAMKYYEREKWKQAGDLFEACQAYYVGDMREDSIAFFTARSRFKGRDYVEATVLLDDFRRKFGRSVFIEDSEAMLAMCHYYLAPDPTRDQTITGEAIIAFSEFIERYPNSKRVEAFSELITELTERLKKKAYLKVAGEGRVLQKDVVRKVLKIKQPEIVIPQQMPTDIEAFNAKLDKQYAKHEKRVRRVLARF